MDGLNMAKTASTELAERRTRGGQPRNGNALKHGLYAKSRDALRLRTRRVRRLVNKVYEACAWLQDSDMACAKSWAELEIMTATMFTYLEQTGIIVNDSKNGDLVPRRLLADYGRLNGLKLQREKELGLTPMARMSLGVKVMEAGDLAAEMQRARGNGGR